VAERRQTVPSEAIGAIGCWADAAEIIGTAEELDRGPEKGPPLIRNLWVSPFAGPRISVLAGGSETGTSLIGTSGVPFSIPTPAITNSRAAP
jgi:hypothetical protein